MASNSGTPSDLVTQRRDMRFGRDTPNPRWWHGGDPGRTAFFNALSSTFPLGEKFFMQSIKRYRDRTEEPLRSQIDDFMYQESMHSREHAVFNRQAEDAGYDIRPLEERTRVTVSWAKSRPHQIQLAATCALEHFTAVLAHGVLADPKYLDGVSPEAFRLWRWHAIEETEHKAVAFDVLQLAGGTVKERRITMLLITVNFIGDTVRNINHMLKRDGYSFWQLMKIWRGGLSFLLGKDGILRGLGREWLDYFKADFHPWQHDNRKLLEEVKANVGPEPVLA